MRKCMMKAWKAIFLVMAVFFMLNTEDVVSAQECISWQGSNENGQDYSVRSQPIYSNLFYDGNQTLIKVQAEYGSGEILIEYYDMDYRLISNKVIQLELPIFGGFYANADHYFIVTGQGNTEESAEVECFRITKYDKSWNRIGVAGLYDCNTTLPFHAGSLRFAESGEWLLIRTAHQMYTASDGLRHQANVTIQLNMETMEITDSYTEVMNTSHGYVSHSFNQFLEVEEDKIVALDHGDAYPRSIVLIKYTTDFTDGSFESSYYGSCIALDVMEFPGEIGANVTGASIGGFEIAPDYYLIAGNSVVQDEQNLERTTRNIFVASVSKSSNEVSTNWITSYAEGEGTTTTPHLVKVSENQYLLMWGRGENIYYTCIDGTGKQQGQIYSMTGSLSDCVPVIVNGKLIWYTWKNEIVTFYEVNLSQLTVTNRIEVNTGHLYENEGAADGYAKLYCKICGKTDMVQVAESIELWWNEDGGSGYSSWIDTSRNVNDIIYYWCSLSECDEIADEVVIESLNPDILEIKDEGYGMGSITIKKEGTATITFEPKYNPDAKETYVFKVYKEGVIPVTFISLSSGYVKLVSGGSKQLEVTVYPETATNKSVSYESSDTSVAEVSDSGLIMAKGVGEAIITVTANDGSDVKDVCEVVVLPAAPGESEPVKPETGEEEGGETGMPDTSIINGLAQSFDGNWYYYVNGKINTDFTGLYCDINYGWWFVRNGQIAFDYNGLYGDANYGWWLIKQGAVDFSYTGLYCDINYGWWLINGGAVDFGYTGLYCDANYGWWLIGGGAVAFDYTGLWGDPTYGWWLVNGGSVNFGYTGLYCDANYGWWLIGGGAVAFDYNGLWGDPVYGWWLVNGGSVNFGYTGLYYDANYGWWYIQGGSVGFGYTGEVYYDGAPYYVVNGQLV